MSERKECHRSIATLNAHKTLIVNTHSLKQARVRQHNAFRFACSTRCVHDYSKVVLGSRLRALINRFLQRLIIAFTHKLLEIHSTCFAFQIDRRVEYDDVFQELAVFNYFESIIILDLLAYAKNFDFGIVDDVLDLLH